MKKTKDEFQSVARRLQFINNRIARRRWGPDKGVMEVEQLHQSVMDLKNELCDFYGPKLANELYYEKGEK